jgi:hypothetical protein
VGVKMSANIPGTVGEAMDQYAPFCEKNRFSMVRTAVERYAVAGWGGPLPKSGRKVSIESQEFLKQLPITKLQSLLTALEAGCELLKLDDKGKKKYRSYAKSFLSFCEEKWMLSSSLTDRAETSKNLNRESIYRLQRVDGSPRIFQVSSTGVKRGSPFALGTQSTHFTIINESNENTQERLNLLALKCISCIQGTCALFVLQHVLGNKLLHQELNELANYLSDLKSSQKIMNVVLAMLGYLHQVQNISVNELSLVKLVPYVKQIYSEFDFTGDLDFELGKDGIPQYPERVEHKLSLTEVLAKRKSQKKAKELIQWVDGFLNWLNSRHIELGNQKGAAIASQRFYITALIHVAKFIYRLETRFKSYKDTEVIVKLKEKRNSLKINKKEQKSRVAARCLTWEEAALVVEMQRKRADARYGVPHIKPSGLYPNKRRSSAIASDIQALLILLLMMLVPCDRQQTYRRLQFCESLNIDEQVEGAFILLGQFQEKVFVPRSKMQDPGQAQWWLAIYDFKTINKYGSFWYPIPNQVFRDGKSFYEYLEMWFFGLNDVGGKWDEYYDFPAEKWQGYIDKNGQKHGWRSALVPDHDFAFSKPRTRTPHDKDSLCSLVKGIFIEFTPLLDRGEIVPVTPHSFRTMLATYTEGQLTPSEELSMAYCEHHSVEKRRNTYTIFENMRKITYAINAMNRINQELFLSQKRAVFDVNEAYLEVINILGTSLLQEMPASVLDAVESYKTNCDSNRYSMLKTAIERYAIAGWGGPIAAKGKHINFDSQTFLKNLLVVNLLTVEVAIRRGCEYLKVSSRTRDKNLSYARKFLVFCKEQGWLPDLSLKELNSNAIESIKYLYSILKNRHSISENEPKLTQLLSTNVSSISSVTLGIPSSDYVFCTQKQQPILGNIELHEELSNFETHLNGSSRASFILFSVRQILGYLHRIKEMPLTELRLTKIIPVIKLTYSEIDFVGDSDFELSKTGLLKYPDRVDRKLSMLERIAQRRSGRIAQDLTHFLDEYFGWLDQRRLNSGAQYGLAESTKRNCLSAFIDLAKYLYREESHNNDFSDIEIINKLREQRNRYKPDKRRQKARVASRCITWEETIQVVEMQRELADIRHYVELLPSQPGRFRLRKKKSSGIAGQIQKALLLMLMTLIPCDRQQTYRRLKFEESLPVDQQTEGAFILWGDFLNQEFIPRTKMKCPEQAQWWLAVYEFKTIEKYGPFWYPLPNQHFIDGKTFYEYLEMWFLGLEDVNSKWPQYYKGADAKWQGYIDENGKKHGWRMALQPKCDSAFFGPASGSPFIKETLGQLIKNIFISFTPKLNQKTTPVTPHSFRTMFATYTSDKLTFAEEESIAYCEHHSVNTRRDDYVLFDNMRQIADAVKVMERINCIFNEVPKNEQ